MKTQSPEERAAELVEDPALRRLLAQEIASARAWGAQFAHERMQSFAPSAEGVLETVHIELNEDDDVAALSTIEEALEAALSNGRMAERATTLRMLEQRAMRHRDSANRISAYRSDPADWRDYEIRLDECNNVIEKLQGHVCEGWTGQPCPRCSKTGENADGSTCQACGGTGNEFDWTDPEHCQMGTECPRRV